MSKYVTLKVWTETRNMLRVLAAIRKKPMTETLNELVQEELKRVGQEELIEQREQ